jgi:hypothetical protein
MEFKQYMHVERFGNDEVQGIELGGCYVFPKIDGTNASVWYNNGLQAGSRKRQLSLDEDNAGFYRWVLEGDHRLEEYFADISVKEQKLRLFGEFLVPHSLRIYREEAWRKLYIFDVYSDTNERFLDYDEYSPLLNNFELDYIPPLCVMNNATYENLLVEIDNNSFLIQEGSGCGEGIVIKNYDYQNKFGRTVWAKIITNAFKEKHGKEMGHTVKNMKQMVEQEICDQYIDSHLVDKIYSKIVNENEGWNSKYIPRLLSTVYYDLINEELWDAVKKLKNPTINFKTLNTLAIIKIKKLKPELF